MLCIHVCSAAKFLTVNVNNFNNSIKNLHMLAESQSSLSCIKQLANGLQFIKSGAQRRILLLHRFNINTSLHPGLQMTSYIRGVRPKPCMRCPPYLR